MHWFYFFHTQCDVLTSVTSIIGYIDPLVDATILTITYDLCITLRTFLYHIRPVESSALGPLLFSARHLIVQNVT